MIEREFEFNRSFYIPISNPLEEQDLIKYCDRDSVERLVDFLQQRHFDTYFRIGDENGHDMLGEYESLGLLGLGTSESIGWVENELKRQSHFDRCVVNGDGRGFRVIGDIYSEGERVIKLKPFGDLLTRIVNTFIRPSMIEVYLSSNRQLLNPVKSKSVEQEAETPQLV